MSRIYKLAIIGGGASGLFASTFFGKEAIVIEHKESCGKKLLLTGGGRCNYTHSSSMPELLDHYNGDKSFIRPALYSFGPNRIVSFFEEKGIEPINENGKIFPRYGNSRDILKVLLENANVYVNTNIQKIEKNEIFKISTNNGTFLASNLLIATGGKNHPETGSDSSGYSLASNFGHSIIKPTPALAPLQFDKPLSMAEGISLPAIITVDKKKYSGDIVITKNGISGPLALDISYIFSEWKEISIEFSSVDFSSLRSNGKSLVKNSIELPSRLIHALLSNLGNKQCANLTKEEEAFIKSQITAYKSYARAIDKGAMSTHGGINTKEVDAKTMESKLVQNLFFSGDILDVDAVCGGYSLTWAFSSAYLATKTILER